MHALAIGWRLGTEDYSRMLLSAELKNASVVYAECKRVISFRKRYEAIGQLAGCPWWLPAVLHMRESNNDFRGVLHNGERIIGTGLKTRLVPRGRGPFNTFEQSAADALKIKNVSAIKTWNADMALGFMERYNGLGYRRRGVPSPYLWSFTTHYTRGKFVADGMYSERTVDKQLGCVAILIGWAHLGIHLEGIMNGETGNNSGTS